MILRRFPGRSASAPGTTRDLSCFGRQNVVVYATTQAVAYAEHAAPLSVKTTLHGHEVYEVDGIPLAVDPGVYLVLNDDQPYASHIDADAAVASFCTFFRDGLDREVAGSFDRSHESLLDDPHATAAAPFFQNLRRCDDDVSREVGRLQAGVARGADDPLWLDERCGAIVEALLRVHRQTLREVEALPFVRQATRMELYRLLYRARDYLASCYAERIGLQDVAAVACLSPHHFLRLFKAVFHVTPHRYLTEVRLQHARRLIETRSCAVADACVLVGFQNPSSFARLFRRRFGRTPRSVRRACEG